MTSPATDPGRAAEEMTEALVAELREDAEIATRCAGWVSDDSEPKPRVNENLSWRAARTIAQIQADLIAARKERDEARSTNRDLHRRTQKAERFRDRWKSWSWMMTKILDFDRRARAAEAEAAQLRARLHEAEKALRPFAGCVFNDNGDVTVSTGHLTTHDWLTAKRTRAALTPAPEANQEAGDGR